MHALLRRLAAAALALLVSLTVFAAPTATMDIDSPVGRWLTFDDRTAEPRGIIRIFERDGKVFGSLERKEDHDLCSVCPDERHNQPLDGLVIIRNMQRSEVDPLEWNGGDVLDPETGKLYHFKMRVEERGAVLVVRGYIGVSALGRSQTWRRVL